MTYATFVRNRNQKTEQAFQAIEDAKRILADLEQITVRAADGKLPDIGETAHLTHGLRESVDRILVGIVESATLPGGQEALAMMDAAHIRPVGEAA